MTNQFTFTHANNNRVRDFISQKMHCRRCGKTTRHQLSLLGRWLCVECGCKFTPIGR